MSDRKRGFSVDVDKKQIDTAVRESSSHCMVTDAIKECYPELRHVSVDIANIRVTDPKTNRRLVYLTPVAAQYAIALFDSGKKPNPFHITLGVNQLAQIQDIGKKKKANDEYRSRRKQREVVEPRLKVKVVKGNAHKRVLAPKSRRIPKIAGRRMFGLKSLGKLFAQTHK